MLSRGSSIDSGPSYDILVNVAVSSSRILSRSVALVMHLKVSISVVPEALSALDYSDSD